MQTLLDLADLLFRRHRNLTIITVMWAVILFFALVSGFWALYRMVYGLTAIVALSYVWTRINMWGLELEVERRDDRAQVGQEITERITVYNRSWLGKLWVEVEDPSDLPGHVAKAVASLGARGFRSWRIATRCTRRGLYSIGPARIVTGDPFGLFHRTRTFGRPAQILVYPLPVEIPHFWVPPANLPGEGRIRRRTHFVTPNAAGVRDYEYGDSFNRIHWPTTARTGRLMVKMFELDPASDIWMILDLDRRVQAGEGDESVEEYGVKIAASVARFFLLANRSVGLISFGKTLDIVEPDRGGQQMTRILESLALAQAVGDVTLSSLIDSQAHRFGRHTTIIVITSSTDESWMVSLHSLLQRGVRAAAILMDPISFGSDRNALITYASLVASDILAYMVRKGDNLTTALSPAGGSSYMAEVAGPGREDGHGSRGG